MSGFVNLHLVVSLQLQGLQGFEEYLFRFDGCIDLDLHRLQAIGRGLIPQGLLAVLARFCHFVC